MREGPSLPAFVLAAMVAACGAGKPSATSCSELRACPAGQSCADGVCLWVCVSDRTCPSKTLTCSQGLCRAGAGQCGADGDCVHPAICELAAAAECFGGACRYAARPIGASCDDGDPCTEPDICGAGGVCLGAPAAACRVPTATAVADLVTSEDTPLAGITLTGSDPQELVSALAVVVTSGPAHGSLSATSGVAPLTLVYAPALNYAGADVFAFTVRDSAGFTSAAVTVSVTVLPVNDAPTTHASTATLGAAGTVSAVVDASDVDADPLTYAIGTAPLFGDVLLDANSGAFSYTAWATFDCSDSFVVAVSDGQLVSAATVTVAQPLPFVNDLAPAAGTTALPLVLGGRGFCGTAGSVTVDARSATVLAWSDSEITVLVPSDLASGDVAVVVTRALGEVAPAVSYHLVPWIAQVAPTGLVQPADVLSIGGDGFGAISGRAFFDAVEAGVLGAQWTNTSVSVTVPGGLVAGRHLFHLETAAGTSSNAWPVIVRGNDLWYLTHPPGARAGHGAVWTGSEMLIWGAGTRGARYQPLADGWQAMAEAGGVSGAQPVWTGTEMLIWDGTGPGGRYDPTTDSWTAMNTVGAPSARLGNHTAVWTGTELIVWGGSTWTGCGMSCPLSLRTGGSYQPATDSWTTVPTFNAPNARYGHTAVWTGSAMVVWGGTGGNDAGGRYDPATATWGTLTLTNAPAARTGHSAVWTGKEMIVWGGDAGAGSVDSGGRYNPLSDTWAATSATLAPTARRGHTAVWTGTDMLIWGGGDTSGGRYAPGTDTWRAMNTSGAPPARTQHSAVWTGAEMIVWGGKSGAALFGDGGRYDPRGDAWTAVRPGAAVAVPDEPPLVFTGTEVIYWGGVAGATRLNTGMRHNLVTDTWTATSMTNAPSAREQHSAVWTGSEMIVWGGIDGGATVVINTGGRYRPATDSWTAVTVSGAPTPRCNHSVVWTGTEMIVWGGDSWTSGLLVTGGRFNPTAAAGAGTWTAMTTAGAPAARLYQSAVWSGSELIVWGGHDYSGNVDLQTGGRYNPGGNAWTATATTGAPSARRGHAVVWTGSKMLVWGGVGPFGDGGVYDPTGNAWSAMTATNAPSARYYHSAVWLGSVMVVWGGLNASGVGLNSGGRYIPGVADSWTAMTTSNAPPLFGSVFANGGEMLVVSPWNEVWHYVP